MTDIERINELLKYTNLNGKNFALRIGLKYPDTIYHILRGRNGISDKLSERIRMAFPEIERSWLLLGDGEMIVSNRESNRGPNSSHALQSTRQVEALTASSEQIPLYEFEAATGLSPIFAHEIEPVDYIQIPGLSRCDGAVYVHSDSMYPLFRSGDIAIYKQVEDARHIIWSEMYLLSFTYNNEEYTTLKYINRVDEHNELIQLTGHNANQAPIEIPLVSIRALALIKATIRLHTMS